MKKITTFLLTALILQSCSLGKNKTDNNISITETVTITSGSPKNQSTISHVALHDDNAEVRKLAVDKLTIQSTLSHVALHDDNAEVRKLAVGKLTTQSTLSHIALHDDNAEVRKLAIQLLN